MIGFEVLEWRWLVRLYSFTKADHIVCLFTFSIFIVSIRIFECESWTYER